MSAVNRDDIAMMIEIPEIYDGVSVYQMKDGTYVNRWAATLGEWPDDLGVQRRFERTETWIARRAATIAEGTKP